MKITAKYRAADEQLGIRDSIALTYDTNMTANEVCETLYALNDEFGMLPTGMMTRDSLGDIYTEKPEIAEPTLKGDANLDSMVDLADLTTVAKYNLNNEAYPLANETAYDNADMNGDGKVDGLDTSALIENQLGK